MTVSRALHRPEAVHPGTRARVMEVVSRLGYVPNAAARSLVNGRTDAIALIVSDVRNPYFANIARGVEEVARQAGYTIILGNSDEQASRERELLDAVTSRQVDGLLISSCGSDLGLVTQRNVPLVLIDRQVPGVAADLVTHDSRAGARAAIEHLLARGYREIAFIGGPAGVSSLEERVAGYREAMEEAGLPPFVRLGRYDQASGEQIVKTLLNEGMMPEALLAANNFVALGAIAALRQHGRSVPEDVGLICFGDLEFAAVLDPFLSVVTHPAHEIGREAMSMLLDRIRGSAEPPSRRTLPVSLIVRRSAPGPRAAAGAS